MRCFLVYLLFLLPFFSYGQNQKKIDSLKEILYNEPGKNSLRANLYVNLADNFIHYDSIIFYLDKGLKLYKKHDTNEIIKTSILIAEFYYLKNKTEKVKQLLLPILEIQNNELNALELSRIYHLLGRVSSKENKDKIALGYYLKVDSVSQNKNINEYQGYALSSIGNFYSNRDSSKAMNYYEKARSIHEKLNNEKGKLLLDYRVGMVNFNNKKYKEAIKLFNSVLPGLENINEFGRVAWINAKIGQAYLRLNEIEKARKYYKESIKINENIGDESGEAYALKALSFLEYKEQNFKSADNLLRKSLIQYKKIGDVNGISFSYLGIAKVNESSDFEKAYEALEYHIKYKDSLVRIRNKKAYEELETKYQTEKKEKEIVLLTSQNELAEQQKTNQRNLLLGGIGLTSIIGIFFFFLYRNRQKTNKKLKEIDTLKSNFFANISHEFRTPLTLIAAPLEKRLEASKLSNEDRSDFEMMQRNSNRLLNLVDQLLDLSKLESGNLKLKVKQGDLSLLLKSLASSFNHLAQQKGINYKVTIQNTENAWFDKDIIEKTVINLLSNAFKYTPDKGNINFKSLIKNNQLQLVIENSGSSLSKEKIEQIFNRFYQADENSEGVGIGLSLVKELVTLSHGHIEIDNTNHDTIVFTLELPITEDEFNQDELIYEKDTRASTKEYKQPLQTITKKNVEENLVIDEDQPILLIVEDNADVREFVTRSFSKTFQVIEAENGKIGIEKAIEYIPDIIISDIMMPKTNGLELCDQLKKDERTSHIPIILLTAKVGEEDKYKGLETGADDYITKPFKIKLLETRVKNLVASRKLLQDSYSQEVILRPKDIAVNSVDEQFLERVQDVLDDKLVESSFNIEEFSQSVGMSRMQLHRKLKALTGLSASEFIRSQRLKLAAQLLKKTDVNVSQIGYSVGFNNHNYFSKCFKKMYNCTPTEYIENTN